MLRAAFMGSPDFAIPSLEAVARTCNLVLVVCQPDRPAGRGRKLTPPPVKAAAERLGVPVVQPAKMKDGSLASKLRELEIDLVVVVAFGRILPPEVLTAPRYGCINVHASVLPRWRGAAPVQRAILAGDRETGVSIMAMDEGLDTGQVHRVARTVIGPEETSGELFARLAVLGAQTLESFLQEFPDVPPPVPQPSEGVTYAPPLRKDEAPVDWHRPCKHVIDHVRGMDPWPVACTRRGDDVLRLYRARPSSRERGANPPGTVIAVDSAGLHVACLDGVVAIAEIQPAGKRRMPAVAYASGKPFGTAERLQ